jgi:hypothetical protein
MGMSYAYGTPDEAESLRTLHRYVERGGNFLDTAEIYGPFDNERLVGRFLNEVDRSTIVVATKFGFRVNAATREISGADSSPANIRRVCDESLGRLGIDRIDLFYQHRVDPNVPIEDVVGTLADLVRAGKDSRDWFVRGRPGDVAPCRGRASNRGAAVGVFVVVARAGNQWRARGLPRAGHRLRRLQSARPWFPDRDDPETVGHVGGRLATHESALPG